jgi:hypothetical protein
LAVGTGLQPVARAIASTCAACADEEVQHALVAQLQVAIALALRTEAQHRLPSAQNEESGLMLLLPSSFNVVISSTGVPGYRTEG